jgi:hypothetical protein
VVENIKKNIKIYPWSLKSDSIPVRGKAYKPASLQT